VDEVNFWQPSAHSFKALSPGDVFLFKLHYPENAIAGGGFFAGYSVLPCELAWQAFGIKNGAASLEAMVARIEHYRRVPVTQETEIGCILLERPFFFPGDEWIPAPEDWAANIVSGKTYDLAVHTDLWESVQFRLLALDPSTVADGEEDLFTEAWVRQRLGQGSFRALVTKTYERRCAVTGEKILPVLQAAHIRPVAAGGRHQIENGLLLRSDLHTLFDRGYVTVSGEGSLRVSGHLKSDFNNGAYYFSMDGQSLWTPPRVEDRPSAEALEWHRDVVFRS